MAKSSSTGKSGKVVLAARITRAERIDAAMQEASRYAGEQLKRQGFMLPVGNWTNDAVNG